jgi:hypothetical protein
MVDLSRCEACRRAQAECTEPSSLAHMPYRLCPGCQGRLAAGSLRPLEWFNLAAIHGPDEHLLRDEAYWFGQAMLSEEEVEDADIYPLPKLEQVKGDLERLLDYAVANRSDLTAKVTEAFAAYPPVQVLQALLRRHELYPSQALELRTLEIAARTLGPVAAGWVRARWAKPNPELLCALGEAAARCLPPEEGYALTRNAVERLPQRQFRKQFMALRWFARTDTLDWIEAHVTRPVSSDWGQLAADSELDWPRAARWLEQGRPLSLVALDGLVHSPLSDTATDTEVEEMIDALLRYLARDPVHRVKAAVLAIIQRWRGTQTSTFEIDGAEWD